MKMAIGLYTRMIAISAVLVCAMLSRPLAVGAAANLLSNGLFKLPPFKIQTRQFHNCGDLSSATDWLTWINTHVACKPPGQNIDVGVELETDLLLGASPEPNIPAVHVIHVRSQVLDLSLASSVGASGGFNGLWQQFGAEDTGPSIVLASVWVYVVHGRVGMGVGNIPDTPPNIKSTKLGKWQQLIGFNAVSPANEFILYSIDPKGSEFYADDAVVCKAETADELASCRHLIGLNSPVP